MDERVADGAAGVGGPVQGAPFAPLHLVPDVGIEDIGQADRARHRKGADQAVVFDVGRGLDNLQRLIAKPNRLLFDCGSAGENSVRGKGMSAKYHEAHKCYYKKTPHSQFLSFRANSILLISSQRSLSSSGIFAKYSWIKTMKTPMKNAVTVDRTTMRERIGLLFFIGTTASSRTCMEEESFA